MTALRTLLVATLLVVLIVAFGAPIAPSAVAAGTGSISGTVTGFGVPVSGLWVSAHDATTFGYVTGVSTGANGDYTLTGLMAGGYVVKFNGRSYNTAHDTDFADEWYQNKYRQADATPVNVVDGAEAADIDADLDHGYQVRGRVTGTGGTPLEGVWVRAYRPDPSFSGVVNTDSQGYFTIGYLDPGEPYSIWFRPTMGYNAANGTSYCDEYYSNVRTEAEATPVAPGTIHVNAQLEVGGRVSGFVTGLGGSPLGTYAVNARDPATNDLKAFAYTNASGFYTLGGLVAGNYKVLFSSSTYNGNNGTQYLDEYYDNSPIWSGAALVPVEFDAETPGINAQIEHANRAPTAADDKYQTDEAVPLIVPAPGVLTNDTDADEDDLTAVKETDPAHGTLSLALDGSFVYSPVVGWSGVDSFTYRAHDGESGSLVVPVTITVRDTTPPAVSAAAPVYSPNLTKVTINASDPGGSGVKQIEYGVNGVAKPSVPGSSAIVSFTKLGPNTLQYRAMDNADNYSGWTTVTFTVKSSTALSLSAPSVSAYRSARLAGRLYDSAGKTVGNKPVLLEYSADGVTWKTLATVYTAKKDSKGWLYEYTAKPSKKTHYRARFTGDAFYFAKTTSAKTVLPKVYLTRTSFGRTTLAYGTAYKARGYLKPRHKAGTYPVKIAAYRYSSGKYRYVKAYSAKAFDYSSYTKYVKSIKLPSKGKWRLRAVHPADSLNAKTYSGYRYVTVE